MSEKEPPEFMRDELASEWAAENKRIEEAAARLGDIASRGEKLKRHRDSNIFRTRLDEIFGK